MKATTPQKAATTPVKVEAKAENHHVAAKPAAKARVSKAKVAKNARPKAVKPKAKSVRPKKSAGNKPRKGAVAKKGQKK